MDKEATVIIAAKTKPAHSLLKTYCLQSNLNIIGRTNCGTDVYSLVQTYRPDLVVMDTELKELSGIEAARQVRLRLDYKPEIIFVTNSLNPFHLMDAVNEFNAYFILKSQLEQYWHTAIRKISIAIGKQSSIEPAKEASNHLIHVRYSRKCYPIAEDLIIMVEKEPGHKYIRIHLTTGEVIRSNSSIQEVREQVSERMFESIRGYLVNIRHVAGYTREASSTKKLVRRYTISFKNSAVTAPMGRLQEKALSNSIKQRKLG